MPIDSHAAYCRLAAAQHARRVRLQREVMGLARRSSVLPAVVAEQVYADTVLAGGISGTRAVARGLDAAPTSVATVLRELRERGLVLEGPVLSPELAEEIAAAIGAIRAAA